MYAVIKAGGKQYRVAPGENLKIEQVQADVGTTIVLDQVLMVADGEAVQVGTPTVAGANVSATVVAHGCPIDLSVVPAGGCVQGTLAGAQVAIGRVGPESLRLYVRAAFARHLATWLTDAATPYR